MRSNWGFYPHMTIEDAERVLKEQGIHGNYICRPSQTTPGNYSLSVRRRNKVWHFKIYNDGEVFEMYTNDGFSSVPDLIAYYRKNPQTFVDADNKVVDLVEPMKLEITDDPGLDQERYFFGEISRQEAEKFLKQRGEHGSYLVRESRSKPGCYVLSVRIGPRVMELIIEYNKGSFDLASSNKFNFPSLNILLKHYSENPFVDKSTDETVELLEPLSDTAERLKNDQRIKKEFEWLQQEDRANTNTKNEGLKPENKGKNRYKNILPFDHTRVVLRNRDPNIPGSDYINASYIFDDESGALFIASQGTVKATVNDFWHMIYQENTRIIIMVTNEVEKAKIKCVRYWPEPGLTNDCGGKLVTNTGETSTRDYIVRQLEIQEKGQNTPSRKIFLYQFVGWPDHGVPKDPGSLLEMMQLIEATQKTFEYPGPPIIHCSAGIGRTGTVIVISMLMSLYRIKGHLEERDVPRTVQKVRLQRSGMVQTETQYSFIYAAIVFFMDTVERRNDLSTQVGKCDVPQEKGTSQDDDKNQTPSKNLYGNLDQMSEMLSNLETEDLPPEPPQPRKSVKDSRSQKPVPNPQHR